MEKKAFYKFQHPFMIKTVNKLSIEGMHTNIKKPYMTSSQLTSYSIMGEKKNFSSKIKKKTRMPILTTFIQYYSKSSQSN